MSNYGPCGPPPLYPDYNVGESIGMGAHLTQVSQWAVPTEENPWLVLTWYDRMTGRLGELNVYQLADRQAFEAAAGFEALLAIGRRYAEYQSCRRETDAIGGGNLPTPITVPTTPAQAFIAGELVKGPDSPAIYLVSNTLALQHICDVPTFLSMFGEEGWTQIRVAPQEDIDDAEVGPSLCLGPPPPTLPPGDGGDGGGEDPIDGPFPTEPVPVGPPAGPPATQRGLWLLAAGVGALLLWPRRR